jgi:hypothetical protein
VHSSFGGDSGRLDRGLKRLLDGIALELERAPSRAVGSGQ